VRRRFQAERQSLAMMDHPAIAKVFDAGTTSDGQPFLVMEYVRGEPITDYCDQKGLEIRERLDLFVAICEGVQHAHRKTIIHRDLKPANLLVVEVDGKPTPRIIDFGLAMTAAPQPDEQKRLTRTGRFLGTPGYMSPEQADPHRSGVDTRTDVYSLGSVLYELTTGVLPFEAGPRQPLDEVLRQLREQDPPRPSARIGAASAGIAASRGTDPKSLARALRGDLDLITMKALERNRERRYGSAAELAEDIKRCRLNEPVLASAPG
jgi:serine/threonine protein kinase